jgi:uncharacterized protein YcfL
MAMKGGFMLGFASGKKLALLMALAAGIMAGCSTTAGIEGVGKTDWDQEGARTLTKNVIINNSSLAGDIEILDMKSFMAGDMMKAQVALRSKDRDTLNIQYAFEWYDLNGMVVGGSTTVWKPLLVLGREVRSIQGVAPDPRGREFKLKIRENNEQ